MKTFNPFNEYLKVALALVFLIVCILLYLKIPE